MNTQETKTYYEQHGICKSKYTVSFHDGKKTHKGGWGTDDSPFYDIAIFNNKKDLARFIKDLVKKGYQER